MAAKENKKTELSFEQRLEKLEALAEKMEQGTSPLQELLRDYEEGIRLSKALETELEKARARMFEIKNGGDATPVIVPSDVAAQGSLLDELIQGE